MDFDARLQGVHLARRGYHHTKACKAKKREFLLTNVRSKELRAAEADPGRNLQVQQNLQVQRDLLDLHERKGTPRWQQDRRRQTLKRRGGRVS